MQALVQVVDGDGVFQPPVYEALEGWASHVGDMPYYTVAVLGAQSSGKSTLLNHVFGTSFAVMNAEAGRSQTTLGVWMGAATADDPDTDNKILVFDVEGTDSRERGEANMSFERKTSLFSLALAEVLVVNLWSHDVGRYNASNLALLKIVFEMNLQLFASSREPRRTLLLFILRDYTHATPVERLREVIERDMEAIWSDIQKPDSFRDVPMSDLFESRVMALSHKELQPQDFADDCKRLRRQFLTPVPVDRIVADDIASPDNDNNNNNNNNNNNGKDGPILEPRFRRRDVPADGLARYCNTVWDTIAENRDLNLPSQRALLAEYRCGQIADESFAAFSDSLAALVADGPLSDAEPIDQAAQDALAAYDAHAAHYIPEEVARRRDELVERIGHAAQAPVESAVHAAGEDAAAHVDKERIPALRANPDGLPFPDLVSRMKGEAVQALRSRVQGAIPASMRSAAWAVRAATDAERRLEALCAERVAAERARLEAELVSDAALVGQRKLAEVGRVLEQPDGRPAEVWPRLRSVAADAVGAAVKRLEDDVRTRLAGDGTSNGNKEKVVDEDVDDTLVETVRERVRDAARKRLRDAAGRLPGRLERAFYDGFAVDEDGVPRRWSPGVDVRSHYQAAVDGALPWADTLAVDRFDDDDQKTPHLSVFPDGYAEAPRWPSGGTGGGSSVDKAPTADASTTEETTAVLLDGGMDEVRDVVARFRRYAHAQYMQAMREQEALEVHARVPPWAWGMMLVLGWNELWAVLSNPLLLVFLVLVGLMAGAVWYMGMGGQVVSMASAAAGTVAARAMQAAAASATRVADGGSSGGSKKKTE